MLQRKKAKDFGRCVACFESQYIYHLRIVFSPSIGHLVIFVWTSVLSLEISFFGSTIFVQDLQRCHIMNIENAQWWFDCSNRCAQAGIYRDIHVLCNQSPREALVQSLGEHTKI